MNILFVTQFFYPENFRINDMAVRLKKLGHSVTVLTGMPNYPKGDFYPGYSFMGPKLEGYEGVDIYRVPVIPRRTGKIWLVLNYLSFVLSAGFGMRRLRDKEFDVIYAFGTSPITQVLPAIFWKKHFKAKLIVNVQDLWPDNVEAITGLKNKAALWLLDKLVDYIYNRCDVILGTSRSFVEAIKERSGLKNKKKVHYYPQYAVVERSSKQRRDLMPEGSFHIAFTGNVGEGQGLDRVLDAAELLKNSGNENNIVFDIFGDGRAREQLETEAAGKRVDDIVIFHGSFPENEIPAILNTADCALLILNDDPIFEKTIPAKLQTYLATATPVLASVKGEAAKLIEDNEIGIVAKDSTAPALFEAAVSIAEADDECLRMMSERALTLANGEFSPKLLIARLERVMEVLSDRK